MISQLSEQEQEHIYVCLKEGTKAFAKQKKGAETLSLSTTAIDEALALNDELRRQFNPRAEEEARDAARKNDPAQRDLEDEGDDE